MKNGLRFLLLALGTMHAVCAAEQESKLYGSWSSDAVATKAYLTKHAVMNEYQKKVLPLLFGRAVVTFSPDGTGIMKLGAGRIPKMDGEEVELGAAEIHFKFEILGETDSQIVIKYLSGETVSDDYPFGILKLHDADTYSVMLSDGITEINGREFFKRVGKEPNKNAGAVEPAASPELSEGSR